MATELTPGEPKQAPEYCVRGGEWYVPMRTTESRLSCFYLHADGEARFGTKHDDKFTGWFATREAALEAIGRWRERQTEVTANTESA